MTSIRQQTDSSFPNLHIVYIGAGGRRAAGSLFIFKFKICPHFGNFIILIQSDGTGTRIVYHGIPLSILLYLSQLVYLVYWCY